MDCESGFKSAFNWDILECLRKNRHDNNSSSKSHRSQARNSIICTILLFSVFIQPAVATAGCSITVLELPFSEELANPCALVDDESLHTDALTEEARESARRTVVDEIMAKALQLKEQAETVLETDLLEGCSSLQLPVVAAIPNADDMTENTPLEVLRLFHTSLLKHAAHIYFMADQMDRHSEDASCTSSDLFNSTESLAVGMRNLVCKVRFGTVAIQDKDEENSFEDLTGQILSQKLSDQSLCSRRSLRDCQTIRSTISVLKELLNYIQTVEFDATTVFGEL